MMRFVLVVFSTAFQSLPVMVNGKVPGAVPGGTVTVMVEEEVAGLGLKVALTPLGKPETLRVTDPE
jgi:hypothetical protein